jgi:hypothetical protein
VSESIRTEFWGHQLDSLINEIVREASICQVRLLDPGVVDAALHDNASACGHDNPAAFKKLRELLMMTFVVRGGKAFDSLGPVEADALIQEMSAKPKVKLGGTAKGRLGGQAS